MEVLQKGNSTSFFNIMSDDVLQWWGFKSGGGDPVTSQWLGVSSVVYPMTAICFYLALVISNYQRTKKTKYDIKWILIGYNTFQVLFSMYIFYETVVSAKESKYNIWCEPAHSTRSVYGRRMAVASWLFYISKYIDLLDTFFIMLKGNMHQISVLHVFHHSSMILNSWLGIRHAPTGHSFFIHLANSFVHILMYAYYLFSSFGQWIKPYLWWKRYLTVIQIVQFFLMVFHMMIGFYNDCPLPKPLAITVIVYLVILISLFMNFFIKTYFGKDKNRMKKD